MASKISRNAIRRAMRNDTTGVSLSYALGRVRTVEVVVVVVTTIKDRAARLTRRRIVRRSADMHRRQPGVARLGGAR